MVIQTGWCADGLDGSYDLMTGTWALLAVESLYLVQLVAAALAVHLVPLVAA
jgi:hypothetical protein